MVGRHDRDHGRVHGYHTHADVYSDTDVYAHEHGHVNTDEHVHLNTDDHGHVNANTHVHVNTGEHGHGYTDQHGISDGNRHGVADVQPGCLAIWSGPASGTLCPAECSWFGQQ